MITVTSDLAPNPSAASVIFGLQVDEDGEAVGECSECGQSFEPDYDGIEGQLQEAELHLDSHARNGL